jgi:predicted nucleotidyltransferase
MLDIINKLAPFFEDCYERIGVREYSKLIKVSPPTASKILKGYEKAGLLEETKYRRYLFFNANRDSKEFIDLSRIYWRGRLDELMSFIVGKSVIEPAIVLFGSLSKAEVKKSSDIDLAVIGADNKADSAEDLRLSKFEKDLDRKVEVFRFRSLSDASKLPIWKAILNGYILKGRL